MNLVRTFILRQRALTILLVLATLCMKVWVPAGFMIGQDSKVLTVQLCNDGLDHNLTKQIAIPMNGEPGDSGGKHEKADGACPFSALSMASLSGADQALLAVALAFILALAFAPTRTAVPKRVFHLRPPLRGPPAIV